MIRVLALLLHNQNLRDQFRSNRSAFITEQELSDEEAKLLSSLDCEQLDCQAEALLSKRRFQVAQIIPQTWSSLGRDAINQFQVYSENANWPKTHNKHELDAQQFCKFLKQRRIQGYLKSEHNWLNFRIHNRWFRIHWVTDLVIDHQKFRGFQVFGRNSSGAPVRRTLFLRRTLNDH